MREKPMVTHADAEAPATHYKTTAKEECLRAEYKQHSQSTNMKHHHEECGKPLRSMKKLVPKKGLEPPHPCEYVDLNHARLPIPPLRL
jgi:hypothetical protein